jgi:hypothetical protein
MLDVHLILAILHHFFVFGEGEDFSPAWTISGSRFRALAQTG